MRYSSLPSSLEVLASHAHVKLALESGEEYDLFLVKHVESTKFDVILSLEGMFAITAFADKVMDNKKEGGLVEIAVTSKDQQKVLQNLPLPIVHCSRSGTLA